MVFRIGQLLAIVVVCLSAGAGCRLAGRPAPDSALDARRLSQEGMAAMDEGRWPEAEALLGRAIEASPGHVEARRHYAETLWQRGAQPAAAAQLEAALALAPGDPALAVRAGEMHLALGDLQRARQKADQGLSIQAQSAAAWALRGRVMRASGDSQQAMADLHRALGFAPDDPGLLVEVAEIYRSRNQPQRALAALERCADLYPPGEEPQHVLYLTGLAYAALARYDEAVETLYAASVRGRPTAEILCRLAEAEHRAGRPTAAEANARQALAVDPQHGPAQALLARLEVAHAN